MALLVLARRKRVRCQRTCGADILVREALTKFISVIPSITTTALSTVFWRHESAAAAGMFLPLFPFLERG